MQTPQQPTQQTNGQETPQETPVTADTLIADYQLDVGRRLQTVRFFLNKTQVQVAAEFGLRQDSVGRLENGLRVSTEVLMKCLHNYQHIYGINPEFMIGLSKDGVAMHQSAGRVVKGTAGNNTGQGPDDSRIKDSLIEQLKGMLDELKSNL